MQSNYPIRQSSNFDTHYWRVLVRYRYFILLALLPTSAFSFLIPFRAFSIVFSEWSVSQELCAP